MQMKLNYISVAIGKEFKMRQLQTKLDGTCSAACKLTALYLRISREDSSRDESYSITNQNKLLTYMAKQLNLTNLKAYIDDGVSGTKLDREQFMEMCRDIENGLVSVVMVKDLSRLSRDKSQANDLVEQFFPLHDVRFISVSDGTDSNDGEDEFLGFRTLMNESYARDISKKRKLTNVVKNNAKEPISLPPYGYIKDPNGKGWIIENEAAEVVRRIFQLSLDGNGVEKIARILSDDGILTPFFYWKSKGINRGGKIADREPYKWNDSTIANILAKQEYCGDIINHKTYSKTFKLKKRFDNPDKSIHKDVHEPIIERAVWELIDERRKDKKRKRRSKNGEKNMFSGLLSCADCGSNLWFHTNSGNPNIKFFACSNHTSNRGTCEDRHYIRVEFLEQVVLQELNRLTKFVKKNEKIFAELIMGQAQQLNSELRQNRQKELYALNERNRELDKLFNRMYEDNVNGKIDDNRFATMSRQYTEEQAELTEKAQTITAELSKQEEKASTAEVFLSVVRKYTRAKKLNERMLNELIERIEVSKAEKIDGVTYQRLRIHYHCIGAIEIPETFSAQEITLPTSQGVVTQYHPYQKSA